MLRYMVHKHDATKAGLHWDLRLEQNGVLKSWAIPKGMPRKSGVRHLAIQTPDHDLSYGKWEGNIPEGSYGAGKVTIDATGEYQTIDQTKKKWKFQCLTGKYKGTWTLIHWKNKQWLIIKGENKKQSYASEEGTPLEDLPEWVEQFLPGPNMNPHYQPLCEQGCYPPEDDNQQCETKDCPDPARTGPMIYSGGYVGKMTLCKICWQGVIEDLEDRYDPETGDFDSRNWWDRDAESDIPRRHTKDAEDDKQVELAVKRTQLSVIRTGLALTTFGIVLWNLWMNKKQAGQIESILDSV